MIQIWEHITAVLPKFLVPYHTGPRPDIWSAANFLVFYKNVDFRVPLILLHKEKIISSMINAENVSFKPTIIIKMFSSTAI